MGVSVVREPEPAPRPVTRSSDRQPSQMTTAGAALPRRDPPGQLNQPGCALTAPASEPANQKFLSLYIKRGLATLWDPSSLFSSSLSPSSSSSPPSFPPSFQPSTRNTAAAQGERLSAQRACGGLVDARAGEGGGEEVRQWLGRRGVHAKMEEGTDGGGLRVDQRTSTSSQCRPEPDARPGKEESSNVRV